MQTPIRSVRPARQRRVRAFPMALRARREARYRRARRRNPSNAKRRAIPTARATTHVCRTCLVHAGATQEMRRGCPTTRRIPAIPIARLAAVRPKPPRTRTHLAPACSYAPPSCDVRRRRNRTSSRATPRQGRRTHEPSTLGPDAARRYRACGSAHLQWRRRGRRAPQAARTAARHAPASWRRRARQDDRMPPAPPSIHSQPQLRLRAPVRHSPTSRLPSCRQRLILHTRAHRDEVATWLSALRVRSAEGDHSDTYWASPLPNDQFSGNTSTKLMKTSSLRMPGRSASSSTIRRYNARFFARGRVLLTVS